MPKKVPPSVEDRPCVARSDLEKGGGGRRGGAWPSPEDQASVTGSADEAEEKRRERKERDRGAAKGYGREARFPVGGTGAV